VTFHRTILRHGCILIGGLAAVPFSAVFAWAAEDQASWRPTYDLVMMWINFGILAFLLAKYARAPLVNLLKGEADKTAAVLKQAQEGRERIDQEVQDTKKALESARERLRDTQEKIMREGARQRQRIIDSAQHESRLLIERTRLKIDVQIAEAHLRLRDELIDRAVALALERLPEEITPEEQARLVDRFIRETRPV
jgi:F-type H+-transporting ATPase subunit b